MGGVSRKIVEIRIKRINIILILIITILIVIMSLSLMINFKRKFSDMSEYCTKQKKINK
jgi:hypothetical protein